MIMGFSCSSSLFSSTNIFLTNQNLCSNPTRPSLSNAQINKIPKFNLLNSSNPPKKLTHLPKETTLQRNLVEKAVGFVVGSVIFIGCFNMATKPAIAIVPSQANSSEKGREFGYENDEEFMYERLLKREPNNVEALKVVLYGKMREGKNGEAFKYAERLAELEPEEVEWRLLMALCCDLMRHLTKAKRLFMEILEERPLLVRALHGLAMAMHKNHEGPAIFEMLDKALRIARREERVTEERDIRILIAQMHVVKGDLEEACEEFKTLVDEDYRDFRPYLCLGIIYSLQEKTKEAAEQFEIYRSLVPEEFPQMGFLDDAVMAAKNISRERAQKGLQDKILGFK